MQKTLAKANKLKLVEKATLSTLAMLFISSGLAIVVNDRLAGIIIILIGVGFIVYREYLKLKK